MIYEPAEDSYLLQRAVRSYAEGRVLDMGTGSGIQALTAIQTPSVREVVAVDKDKEAISTLQEQIKSQRLRKIKVLQSDLFEQVEGYFDLIIFNPPYLPQDKGVEDTALYGGKKGWEMVEQFLHRAASYLLPTGKILLLFSSLTNREKIHDLIAQHLFTYQEIERQKLAFEELYVYIIEKSALLKRLEQKGIEQVCYFAKGKRGVVYRGVLDRSKLVKTHFPSKKDLLHVAIKVKRDDSKAVERIHNEGVWLRQLHQHGIGPRLLFEDAEGIVYEFVEGEYVLDWISHAGKPEIVSMLRTVLEQCYALDLLGLNKEEMHHPQKHIIIDAFGRPTLLDFERCSLSANPKNVTQYIEFISRIAPELKKKGLTISPEELRIFAQQYKETKSKEQFLVLLKAIR